MVWIILSVPESFPEPCLHILVKLFNTIWTTGDIPPILEGGFGGSFPKPGKDPFDASHYRPIALRSCLCKTVVPFQNPVRIPLMLLTIDLLRSGAACVRPSSEWEEGGFVNLEKEFEPTLLNTTVYIISMSLQVSTFAVNYKGEPFMERLRDNKPLLYSLAFSATAVLVLASGVVPEVQEQFELVQLPLEFRNIVLGTVIGDIVAVYLIDRIMQFALGGGRLRSTY
ncbi:cation-transporting ATPase [Plakobranchus ocellatus]|uniref:Cation-transporting ATPase n=1 Tax=Plakobranchus ocellatus TaxID=259542 RepID=A0AAV4DRM3_9GAST|nr:cation-transporting ATPase [Plakobranchus ocellatus]